MNKTITGAVSSKRMSVSESIIFVAIFILPFFFFATSSGETGTVQYLAFIAAALLFVFRPQYLAKVISGPYLALVLLYIVGILIKFIVHGKFSMMGAVMPLVGMFGYYYISDKSIRLEVFDVLLVTMYVYFIYTFFFHLEGVFIRAQLENEGDFFGRSSTNFIPIILINILYIYQVVAYLQNQNRDWLFLLYSTINFVLILIQQSRSGILVSSLFVMYNLYVLVRHSKSFLVRVLPLFISIIGIYYYMRTGGRFVDYTNQLGEGGFSYMDTRGMQAATFFGQMDLSTFLFGYPPGTSFGNEYYVFNTFLNQWNIYTFLGFFVTLVLILRRFFCYKKFFFPWYFLIPFIMYSFSEPRYLPNYWDFFIYLLLLKRIDR